jgi:hypothetical protein
VVELLEPKVVQPSGNAENAAHASVANVEIPENKQGDARIAQQAESHSSPVVHTQPTPHIHNSNNNIATQHHHQQAATVTKQQLEEYYRNGARQHVQIAAYKHWVSWKIGQHYLYYAEPGVDAKVQKTIPEKRHYWYVSPTFSYSSSYF